MTTEPDWRQFERTIHAELTSKYPEATIRHDVKVFGSLSGVQRQIDVLVEEVLPGGTVSTAVDAKYHGRQIDVKAVESFIGLLRDTSVNRGIMVSASGYTDAGLNRAFRDDVDLDLDVFTLHEFKQWQAACALPYAGRNAVFLSAPFGWAVDGQRHADCIARLYRRGLTFEQAAAQKEFMYVNLWDRRPPVESLDSLLADQNTGIRSHDPDAIVAVREVPGSRGHRACVRRAEIRGYPTAEITGFVEFPKSIFFVVLFTPLVIERRNVRKLEYMPKKTLPISVRQSGLTV
jgi:hypothetical protein